MAMLGNSSLQEDRERPAWAAPREEESRNGYVTFGNNKYCKAGRSWASIIRSSDLIQL